MDWEWAIGYYKGEQAKHVLELANTGTGYFIRRTAGKGQSLQVEAAFRRPLDGPRPEHLGVADVVASQKLDRLLEQRQGRERRSREITRASDAKINEVRTILEKKKQTAIN